MIKYRNINDPLTDEQKEAFYTPVGSPIVPEFEVGEDGMLVKTGEINVDELIQTFKDEVNLATLISRATNGDPSALSRKVGAFVDTVEAPKSLLEAERMAAFGMDVMQKLPAELRARLQTEDDFLSALKDGSLLSALEGKDVVNVESIEQRLARLEEMSRVNNGGNKDE